MVLGKKSIFLGTILIFIMGAIFSICIFAYTGWLEPVYGIGKYERASLIDLVIICVATFSTFIIAIYIRNFVLSDFKKQLHLSHTSEKSYEIVTLMKKLYFLISNLEHMAGPNKTAPIKGKAEELRIEIIHYHDLSNYLKVDILLEELISAIDNNTGTTKIKEIKVDLEKSFNLLRTEEYDGN